MTDEILKCLTLINMFFFSNKRVLVFILFVSISIILGACSSSSSDDTDDPVGLLWDYGSGSLGPSNWASLSVDFALCGSGTQQSPIDILDDRIDDAPAWQFDWGASTLKMINDGRNIHVLYNPGSSIVDSGVEFELKSFHIHVSSEHYYQGNPFDGEIHFVHESSAGNFAVVAVWITEGTEHKDLPIILANMPIVDNETFDDPSTFVRARDYLPESGDYFRYDGSLSEPPCTESVTWVVLRQSIELSTNQLQFFENVLGENIRPLQPLNGRVVVQQ